MKVGRCQNPARGPSHREGKADIKKGAISDCVSQMLRCWLRSQHRWCGARNFQVPKL